MQTRYDEFFGKCKHLRLIVLSGFLTIDPVGYAKIIKLSHGVNQFNYLKIRGVTPFNKYF